MAAVSTVETKPKREKKPSLPAKLQKFASTMYFILQTFNEQGFISDEDLERGIVENHLFDHIDNLQQQTVVLEALLDQQPAALKSFRKTATARNKPPKAPKAPKEKKEKAPKEKKANGIAVVSPATEEPIAGELEEEEIDEDGGAGVSPAEEEVEVKVKRFEHNGVKWLRDSTGVIYNMETQEEVGVWNEEMQTIVMNE